jgi:hypothetical protein
MSLPWNHWAYTRATMSQRMEDIYEAAHDLDTELAEDAGERLERARTDVMLERRATGQVRWVRMAEQQMD